VPESAAQSEAVRIVAEQLFTVWKAEQEREAKANRRFIGSNLSGWLAAFVIFVGGITAGVSTYNLAQEANARSVRNETAITVLKADNGDRLARIETKIDMMMGEEGSAR
jgi:hypothetical protein